MKKALFIIGGIVGASAIIYFGYKMVKGKGTKTEDNSVGDAAQKAKEVADAKTASGIDVSSGVVDPTTGKTRYLTNDGRRVVVPLTPVIANVGGGRK